MNWLNSAIYARLVWCLAVLVGLQAPSVCRGEDWLAAMQSAAVTSGKCSVAHWGTDPARYVTWSSHSNRLVPVYTFGTLGAGAGIDLTSYTGEQSAYRSADRLTAIYGYLPSRSVAPSAEYLDQTDLYRLQQAAAAGGKKHLFLVIFDGMDWQTTRAAAIYRSGKVGYSQGRGAGNFFQEYEAAGTAQFGSMATSPHNDGTKVDLDAQTVLNPGGTLLGGYDPDRGGAFPWSAPADEAYLLGKGEQAAAPHAYTDSASSATSMSAGIKTFNIAINVDARGKQVATIAHDLQQAGMSVGVVTSVPVSHATPAAMYAHNVHRDDYQDLTRDLLGLRSVSHPEAPLAGLDVVIGAGFGVELTRDSGQGGNFVPGNRYLTASDLAACDVNHGGRYVTAVRTRGANGSELLRTAAERAAAGGARLFGFFGTGGEHPTYAANLPLRTADGDFRPAEGKGRGDRIVYADADLAENPTLADMTEAALALLSKNPKGFWLMVEAGDVDWANHDNNLDAAIGAVISGDHAVRSIAAWVDKHSNWNESLMIVTADHGHYLVIDNPYGLIPPAP